MTRCTTLLWPDVLTLDGWWVESSGICRHRDWGETTSHEDQPDCPIPPGGIENYLETLPDDKRIIRLIDPSDGRWVRRLVFDPLTAT